MKDNKQAEKLISAWVKLTSVLKNTRITKELPYNEAIIMMLLYGRYKKDPQGAVSVKEIIEETKMLKSLANRTINSLEKKGLLTRCVLSGDKRIAYVRCSEENLDAYLKVHNESLGHAQNIIDIIGEEDTETFLKIVKKIEMAGYSLT